MVGKDAYGVLVCSASLPSSLLPLFSSLQSVSPRLPYLSSRTINFDSISIRFLLRSIPNFLSFLVFLSAKFLSSQKLSPHIPLSLHIFTCLSPRQLYLSHCFFNTSVVFFPVSLSNSRSLSSIVFALRTLSYILQ